MRPGRGLGGTPTAAGAAGAGRPRRHSGERGGGRGRGWGSGGRAGHGAGKPALRRDAPAGREREALRRPARGLPAGAGQTFLSLLPSPEVKSRARTPRRGRALGRPGRWGGGDPGLREEGARGGAGPPPSALSRAGAWGSRRAGRGSARRARACPPWAAWRRRWTGKPTVRPRPRLAARPGRTGAGGAGSGRGWWWPSRDSTVPLPAAGPRPLGLWGARRGGRAGGRPRGRCRGSRASAGAPRSPPAGGWRARGGLAERSSPLSAGAFCGGRTDSSARRGRGKLDAA